MRFMIVTGSLRQLCEELLRQNAELEIQPPEEEGMIRLVYTAPMQGVNFEVN